MSSKETVKRSFGERASEWATAYSDPDSQSLNLKNLMTRQRFVLQMVEAGLPRGSKILDIGCGPGAMAAKLQERGYDVWGMDIAEPMVWYARERCGADRFRVGDIENIPFQDGAFDGVVCVGVLEYLEADTRALREIGRVLRPGGKAVLSTPNAICPWRHIDRAVAAAESLYGSAKSQLNGKPVSVGEATGGVGHRVYRRARWLRLLRSMGFEQEEWMCYGWGWYTSRLGVLAERLFRGVESLRRILERPVGRRRLQGAGDRLARSRLANWIAYEQLVRLRLVREA